MTRIGTDTGFYVELLRGHAEAVRVWKDFMEGDSEGFCAALSVFELKRLGLKGKISENAAAALIEAIPAICKIHWISGLDLLTYAARLSHGLGIPSMDSLILASLIEAGSEIIYTTDSHLEAYEKKGVSVVNLGKDISC